MKIIDIEYIFPEYLIDIPEELEKSIKKTGIVSPVIVVGNIVIDGNRRVKVCKKLGIKDIEVIQLKVDNANPYLLCAELNYHRRFTPFEIGWLCIHVNQSEYKELCLNCNVQHSPQMVEVLQYLGENHKQIHNQLPLNIWRELAHIENGLEKYGVLLGDIEGTVSEKRVVANLLRHCYRKKSLPESLESSNAGELIKILEQRAKPRQNNALEKWNNALSSLSIPKGLKLKIDPCFEKPGILVNIHITRKNISRIIDTKDVLEHLFNSIEEL